MAKNSRARVPGLSALKLHVRYEPIASLRRYEDNARTHSADQVSQLAKSIKEFGFVSPLLVEKDGTIIGGHGRLEAAQLAGLVKVPVIRLEHLSEVQARALRIADNKLAELAGWDSELLADELGALQDLKFDVGLTGFDEASLAELFKTVGDATPEEAIDATPEPEEEPDVEAETAYTRSTTRLGDLWELGKHRLYCENSLQPANLKRLMGSRKADLVVTDPPYAIYGSATGISSDVADDKMVRPFFRDVLGAARSHTRLFAHIYVFCDWRSWPSWWEVAKEIGQLAPKNLIVWDKGGAGLGSNYANTYEMIGFLAHLPTQTTMTSNAKAGQRVVHKSNIMRHARASGAERRHNAAKPVALLAELLKNSSDEGELVLDMFCGSGSTLIACEMNSRVCNTVEIEPKHCDTTIDRWQKLTGHQAKLAAGGKTFAEVAEERAEPA